jgi:hypothetical protein
MSGKYRTKAEIYGCDPADIAEMRAVCRALVRGGMTYQRTPLGAYVTHQMNARLRSIEWHLTFPEWWGIWMASGRWEERGNHGYCMCRIGDVGPYAVGNVFIGTIAENTRAAHKKDIALPLGVVRRRSGFVASRRVHGKRHYLGFFSTPELAHAAYLNAAPNPLLFLRAAGSAGTESPSPRSVPAAFHEVA